MVNDLQTLFLVLALTVQRGADFGSTHYGFKISRFLADIILHVMHSSPCSSSSFSMLHANN